MEQLIQRPNRAAAKTLHFQDIETFCEPEAAVENFFKIYSPVQQKSLKNIGFLLYSSDFWFRLATSYLRFDTIFGVQWLNFRVRDGNGCDPLAIVTILFSWTFQKQTPAST